MIGDRERCLRHIGESRFDEAASKCDELGASLPLPKNEEENQDLYAAVQTLGLVSSTRVALDGSDVNNEGEWVDSTGTTIKYFNWWPSEPSGGVEHYLEYWIDERWNDIAGSSLAKVVCWKPEINGKF